MAGLFPPPGGADRVPEWTQLGVSGLARLVVPLAVGLHLMLRSEVT